MVCVSIGVFITAGWLWYRSVQFADYFYRPEPTPNGGTALKGFGSYRGAVVIGAIEDPSPGNAVPSSAPPTPYRHDTYPLGNGSLMQAKPDVKVSALGFGVSRGEFRLNLPLSFLLPRRTYRAIYMPYYFIMLLAIVQPVRVARRARRRPAALAIES